MLRVLSVPLLLAPLKSQTIFVDTNNDPGTHFTDLPTAVAAVPDGAVLQVRAGSYSGFSVSGKGLSILGAAGVSITSPISVQKCARRSCTTGCLFPRPPSARRPGTGNSGSGDRANSMSCCRTTTAGR